MVSADNDKMRMSGARIGAVLNVMWSGIDYAVLAKPDGGSNGYIKILLIERIEN